MRDNGNLPAFPTHTREGLTKREYFAALALQGITSNPELLERLPWEDLKSGVDEIAKAAVLTADALLAALDTPVTPEAHIDV